MSTAFDLSKISKRKQHVYFYIFLVLLALLAGTIKNHFYPNPSSESQLADEVKQLLDMGATVKDLY